MVIALVRSAQSALLKRRGFARMKQAVLTMAPIGVVLIVQAGNAPCATSKIFPTALQRIPARKRVASGVFHQRQTTVGALHPARFAQTLRRGIVTLNKSALGQTHSGAQAAGVQALLALITPVPLIVPTRARPAQLKTLGTAMTRTRASQTAGIGAGITAPLLLARFVLLTRSGTVTRSRPVRLLGATGATLTALQASAQAALPKTQAIAITRKHALARERNGAGLIVLQAAHCALTLRRGIVTLKKIVLVQAATGVAIIAPTSHARNARKKTPGHAVTKNHAPALAAIGANQPGRVEKAGALTTHVQPLHCTQCAGMVYANLTLGKAV